ncbi:MAG: hypothetical protein WCR06_10770 [bacterium]
MKRHGLVSVLIVALFVAYPASGAAAPAAPAASLAVQEIQITPLVVPKDQKCFIPVQIASGGLDSAPHQARVVIQTRSGSADSSQYGAETPYGVTTNGLEPAKAVGSVPVRASGRLSVQLIGGNGARTNKAARLVLKGVIAIGGRGAVLAEIDPQGRIEGVLTSSDAIESCVIQAGDKQALVQFTGCQVEDLDGLQNLWLEPGTYTNRVRLQHIRGRDDRDDESVHGVPVAGHELRAAATGRLRVGEFEERSTDLSAWVHYPTNAFVTDAAGCVNVPFTISAIRPVQLDAAWLDVSVFDESLAASDSPAEPGDLSTNRQDRMLENRLTQIIIPEIMLRNASLRQAVLFLESACATFGTDDKKQNEIRFFVSGQNDFLKRQVTFTARFISALDALKIISEVAEMKYALRDASIVFITPAPTPPVAMESDGTPASFSPSGRNDSDPFADPGR